MTALAQLLLFLSSYTPLFVVLALLDSFGKGVPTVVCVALAGVGTLATTLLPLAASRVAAQDLRVETAEHRDSDVLAYVASYLVPFAATAAPTGRERAALLVFVGLVAVLYVRAELFYVNPLLAVFRYRLFAVVTEGGTPVALLTRSRFVAPSSEVRVRRLGEYVYVAAP